MPIEWHETDSGTGAPVVCRGMLDHFEVGAIATVYDLKTTESAAPPACERSAYLYGYDIQAAAYTSAVTKLHPEMAGLVEFVFLFAETTPPYAVYPCRPDGTFRELGERRWQRAVDLWAGCLRTGQWPGYTQHVGLLSAPTWALSQEEGLL